MHRKSLYMAVFISGLTSLAVEMTAERLLARYFGASNLIWACVIGLILIYLTAGYFLGGIWADRSPHYSTMFKIQAWAAFAVGLMPILSRPILRVSANAFDQLQMGVVIGAFVTTLVLFIVPIILLGTTSPFAIRLAITDSRQAGRTSGNLYAVSTLGSFIGTFLPTLLLLPTVGTYRTFIILAVLLSLGALYGLWRTVSLGAAVRYVWVPVVLVVIGVFGTLGSDRSTQDMIYETDSGYNYIQVLDLDGTRVLRLNEGQGMHSMYTPQITNFHGPWEQVLAAPYFNPAPYDPSAVKHMAIVGLAAGTTAREAAAAYPGILIDGIEIDPKIIEVARKYFDMNDPNLNVIIEDGRVGLRKSTQRYQIISVDAYRPPYIPWHMTTQEFFQLTRDRLTDDGVLVINVGRAPDDRRLINAISSTIRSVYPSVYVIDIPNTFNSIIYATVQPTDIGNLDTNLAYLVSRPDTHPMLIESVYTALTNLQPTPPAGTVFTDDLAPVEWITNSMIANFFLSGEVENLQ